MKGPDVMSKSDHTQRCYADSWANQTTDYKICNSFDYFFFSTGAGVKTGIVKPKRKHFKMQKMPPYYISMHAPLKLFVDSLIDLGISGALTS